MHAILTGLSHIKIEGEDALNWLQNLITPDIESQPLGSAIAAALLTPQGKILFDFRVLKAADQSLILECRTEIAPALVQRLTMYKLRAKLTIGNAQPAQIAVDNESGTWHDLRFATPVWRSVTVGAGGDRAPYDALRIEHGVAESGSDYALGDYFPHDVNLDQTGGIGFRKGCYVGQEVVSRMQHRGTARRRLVIVEGAQDLPVRGTMVMAGDRDIGTIGTVAGKRGLAIIRLDKAAEAAVPVTAGGVALTILLPEGATFSLTPEAEA
jgi:tRNA-modifying protein YgfZ